MGHFGQVVKRRFKNAQLLNAHIIIHSGYFYSASSSPQLFRGAPETARILSQNFTTKRHR